MTSNSDDEKTDETKELMEKKQQKLKAGKACFSKT